MAAHRTEWLDKFLKAYFTAALWSSRDSRGRPMRDSFSEDDIAENTRLHQISQCHAFVEANWADLQDLSPAVMGRAFFNMRCGNGILDDLKGERADRLMEACQRYGEVDLYDDAIGEVHAAGCEQPPGAEQLAFLPPAVSRDELIRLATLWGNDSSPSLPIDQVLADKGYAVISNGVAMRNEAQPVFAASGDVLFVVRRGLWVPPSKQFVPYSGASVAP